MPLSGLPPNDAGSNDDGEKENNKSRKKMVDSGDVIIKILISHEATKLRPQQFTSPLESLVKMLILSSSSPKISHQPFKNASLKAIPLPSATLTKRQILLGSLSSIFTVATSLSSPTLPAAVAFAGIESMDSPIQLPAAPEIVQQIQQRNKEKLNAAEKSFQDSDLLKELKEKSEQNRDANKKKLQDTYCRRQAELGVGDCAGLRLIPGMTKSGVQKRPEWLEKLVGGGGD